jgi:hypothetical protein
MTTGHITGTGTRHMATGNITGPGTRHMTTGHITGPGTRHMTTGYITGPGKRHGIATARSHSSGEVGCARHVAPRGLCGGDKTWHVCIYLKTFPDSKQDA